MDPMHWHAVQLKHAYSCERLRLGSPVSLAAGDERGKRGE